MESYQTPSDFGPGVQGEVRRWLTELKLADKREEDYRKKGAKLFERYRAQNRKKNSFNILWSNTETLAPAVFNSPPQPNVRRRFKDADPVGKVVAQILERSLEFQTDTEQFMNAIKYDVLDMLLPGRGVSRIRYVPSLVQVGTPTPNEEAEEPTHEAMEGEAEELAWEQVVLEHVQWDDFRHGPGKTWPEVPWVGFRHRMNRETLTKLAGEKVAKLIPLDQPADDDLKKDGDLSEVFQTAEVWELWDKDTRKVRFLCENYKANFLKVVDDPLRLNDFFPVPRPLIAIADSASLEPVPLYDQYEEQADELNRISYRISKIIDACKLRGIYDAVVTELNELMRADDNKLVPTQNARAFMDKGFDKAVWMWPAETAANVLQILYQQREATKQVIYEITGIADVMRGATNPNETLGAQQLKAQWGGQRVQAMQREVQRYARDQIRLMSEVVADRFQPETLVKMTGINIPTEAQFKSMQAQAQLAGQQIPQPPILLDQVMAVMRDDCLRAYKVDVETDSMIAATMQQDMQGIRDLLTGVQAVFSAFGPAVQAGAVPIEGPRELLLAVLRRSKFGSAVEDAFEGMQQPQQQPQNDSGAAKEQAELQLKAQQQQHDQAMEVRQQQHEEQIAAREQMHAEQIARLEQQRAAEKQASEERFKAAELAQNERFELMEQNFNRWRAELEAAVRVETANISSKSKITDAATATATAEIAQDVRQDGQPQ